MTKSQSDEELPSKNKDTIFNLLFTKMENKEILKNFLEKIFMQRISYVTLNNSSFQNSSNKAVLDAIVKINDNLCCNTEIQLIKKDYLIDKLLQHWSNNYTKNNIKIFLTDFEMSRLENLSYFTKWKVARNESCHKILSDNMEVYIINLPPLFKKLETNNILDIIKFIELSNSPKIGKYNTIQNILKINESYFYN